MWRILLAVLIFGSSTLSAAPGTILVLGDSLSAAHNIPIEQGWVHLLVRKLAESHPGQWRIVNASISGETTAGGLARLPAALTKHKPNWVLIELGANDGLRGLQVSSMRANLLRMIELAQAAGAKVGLIGIEIPGNYGEAYRSRFRAVYADLAAQTKTPLLPFLLEDVAGDLKNFQEDQVHPTAAVQGQIRDHVADWLVPLL